MEQKLAGHPALDKEQNQSITSGRKEQADIFDSQVGSGTCTGSALLFSCSKVKL